MSVFNDFQRLWMQRFPQSSLSDAWEQDVRASLERHKQKIGELQKELEQETLYVEYLERLLSDVEKFRESGGDPTTLFEAATGSAVGTGLAQSEEESADIDGGDGDHIMVHDRATDSLEPLMRKSSLNLRETSGSENKDKHTRLSLNTDNKFVNNNATKRSPLSGTNNNTSTTTGSTAATTSANTTSVSSHSIREDVEPKRYEQEDKDAGNEKDMRHEKNGALHQCITELAASAAMNNSSGGGSGGGGEVEAKESASSSSSTTSSYAGGSLEKKKKPSSSTTSHFVTVIEVKESKDSDEKHLESNDMMSGGGGGSSSFSSFERKPSAPPLSPALTSPSMSASAYADGKKKMPPRPPPKNIRRVEPPTIPGSGGGAALSSSPKRDGPFAGSTIPLPSSSGSFSSSDSPGNSLERNIKPSDILRQKSSESLEAKSFAASNRKTTPELTRFSNAPELMEEFGRKVGKSESLEKTKRSGDVTSGQSPTSSLGRAGSTPTRSMAPGRTGGNQMGVSPTGSLSKQPQPPSGSLEHKPPRSSLQAADAEAQSGHQAVARSGGSKESLTSQGITDIIKSYESISSLSSDSAKAAAQGGDVEPYYDSVPVDNNEGEYVFINAGRTASSSSRDDLSGAGSTLPMGGGGGGGPPGHLTSQQSVTDPESPGRNYVNINYFLNSQSNETRSSSLDSDGEYEGPPILRTISHDEQTSQTTPGALRKTLVSAILNTGNARGAKIRSILNSIIQSETIYVECLNKMLQYKRAIHSTLGTSQPVIKEDEEKTIFFKIDELYEVHSAFLKDLKTIVSHEGGDVLIGESFKRLADMINLYSAFLHNYGQAIETVKKCSANNPRFNKSVSTIVVNLQTEQSLTLEDLLHKPVARVQINALVFTDLLRETPPNHPDHQPLRQAHKNILMFLKQFNVVNQPSLPSESNRSLRRMIKNSFIVELVDGHRKLRHLILFNDAIACCKYKASGRDRIEYELKWFIPLKDVVVYEESDLAADLKESSPANILQLKTQACTVRDQLLAEEKDADKNRKTNGVRAGDKYRRKLADLESQLVLASPNLVFRIGNKATNKTHTFFLSSDFERTQWIESIMSLKEMCNIPGASIINALEVQAFIVAMQKGMKIEMGSYLMRNTNDESLLVGDLHMCVQGLTGLDQPADLYVCIEVDSYGHYFRKATTKLVCRSMSPLWNESFVLELEGSQNVRILLYESHMERPKLRAKYVLKLSRSWLQETTATPKILKMGESITLNTTFRFVPGEITLRRVPTSKPGALFGAKMSQVLKREKRDIPFIISACIREVERRGMSEVGIYRVSGSASDLAKLKKSFETNPYEAEQLLKDVDIHSVTGILKSYLRELPEALFSDLLYPKFFDTFSAYSTNNEEARIEALLKVFEELPESNRACINHILDHLIRVHYQEADNKMSLHNLAMVFGPTLLRPGQTQAKQKDLLASSTVDAMAQAGILYSFLQSRKRD